MLRANDLINQMSSDFGMLPGHLKSIVRTAPIRYKVFYIPKRSGGLRELAQPAREVKAIQRWLMERLEPLLPLHEAATAYRPGASIKNNALQHVESNYLLKMDFTNFFPSILMTDIVRHLEVYCRKHYDTSAIKLIAYVCTWAPKRQGPLRLCIGAPSSPLLSNSVMFDFDTRLTALAARDQITYTRYADDLALSASTSGVLNDFPNLVSEVAARLEYPKLVINAKKTVFASRAGRRVVTGVTLTADHQLSIGRVRKRQIRAMYHRMMMGKLNPEEQRELAGLISFADDIEPGFSAWLARATEA
jgi:RNA-directed DNA polymerase